MPPSGREWYRGPTFFQDAGAYHRTLCRCRRRVQLPRRMVEGCSAWPSSWRAPQDFLSALGACGMDTRFLQMATRPASNLGVAAQRHARWARMLRSSLFVMPASRSGRVGSGNLARVLASRHGAVEPPGSSWEPGIREWRLHARQGVEPHAPWCADAASPPRGANPIQEDFARSGRHPDPSRLETLMTTDRPTG